MAMTANQLFNISRAARAPSPTAAPGAPSESIGVITTGQSVITFAGAPAAITMLWKVIGAVQPSLANYKWLPLIASILVGMLIYWQSADVAGTAKQKVVGFGFALINSFAIAFTVLGLND